MSRQGKRLGRRAIACESHVPEPESGVAGTRVPRDPRNLVGIWGDHPPRLNTP
jgi:hypothetical protein